MTDTDSVVGEGAAAPGTTAPGAPALAPDEFRRIGYAAVDLAADYLAGIRRTPVFQPMTPDQRRALRDRELRPEGRSPDALLAEFARDILPFAMGNGHPRFFGWVNSPPAHLGVIAEFLAAAQDPSTDIGDLSSLYLEEAVIRWLAELTGFPTDAAGILVSGGSMATLTCLAAARQRAAEKLGRDLRAEGLQAPGHAPFIVYTSTQTHSSVRKAIELLGLGHANLRVLPVDAARRFDVPALAAAIEADLAAGLEPCCIVATAGTTNTGALDPFDQLADLRDEYGLWLHVDGAYGAIGRVLPELADAYRGLERADSLSLDPHKWLSVPVECGCALVRDTALLNRTFSHVPDYLVTEQDVGVGGPSFADLGFQQTRGFRALKLWMTLEHLGRTGVTDLIRRTVGLAHRLARLIEAEPDLELCSEGDLSVVCLRYRPRDPDLTPTQLDALNRAIEAAVQTEGAVFLTSTKLDGVFVLRACVLHYDTQEQDLEQLVRTVLTTGERVLSAEQLPQSTSR